MSIVTLKSQVHSIYHSLVEINRYSFLVDFHFESSSQSSPRLI